MNILDYIKNNILILDGGTGTLLQEQGLSVGELPEEWNISHPEIIQKIHQSYFDAGSNVVATNTFGANLLKFSEDKLDKIIGAAVENAKIALASSKGNQEKFIALDIGPSGKLLKPYGDFDFEDAVSLFSKTIMLGVKHGVDLIYIETMSDSYETKAALLAAKEASSLPVFVSNAYGSDCRLLTGATPAAMATMLEAMGADAIGANCSQGPAQLAPVIEELARYTSLPIILKPNAGLPEIRDGKTVYNVLPEEFSSEVVSLIDKGACILGGCCGTTPEYISKLSEKCKCLFPAKRNPKKITAISSYTHTVEFGEKPILIGERINPTGKKRVKEALHSNNFDYILKEALMQEECGVQVLDVNAGLPEIDERETLNNIIAEIQAVCNLPLQIDTSNTNAMELALRRYNGKALINSVNGKEESLRKVFPLMKKYGGVAVALTLDENGIPETAEGRVEIAKRILSVASEYGIDKKDIIFDPLTLTVSADKSSARITLDALSLIHNELGAYTILGVSNISFGLPNRDILNSIFFASALENHLSAAIMNPYSREMMSAYYSYCALNSLDESFENYIGFAANLDTGASNLPTLNQTSTSSDIATLEDAIVKGLKDKARELCLALLGEKQPLYIVNEQIIPALDRVGKGFENHSVYLPNLLMSAEAARSAFEPIHDALFSSAKSSQSKKQIIVLATVKGDIHDIGKNIVALLLENYGFSVIDLGKDVTPQKILEATLKYDARLVGLSALMTTTVPAMEETIKLLKEKAPLCKVVVGGAVLTKSYADKIGADFYAADAMETVRFAEKIFK